MTVGDLVTVLSALDPKLPVATYAANSLSVDVDTISLLKHYTGEYVLIGDQSKKNLNPPNWYIIGNIYGRRLPEEWRAKERT